MSFSTITVPSFASVIPVDTRSTLKVLYLPTASTNIGRYLLVKDYYGTSFQSTITISTTGADLIEGINWRLNLSNAFASISFVSDGLSSWRTLSFYNGAFTPIAFLPTQISGLQLWLDGSDSSSMNLSGTTITQWRDKSGLGNNTTGGSGTVSLVTNAVNGLSVASLANTFLTGGFATAFTGTQLQCFAVALMNSSSTAFGRILSLGRPGVHDFNQTTTTFPFIRDSGTTRIMIGRNSSYLAVNTPGYATTFLVQSGHNGSTEFIGVNGATPATQNTGVTSGFNITSYGIGTNTNTTDTGGYWNGYIAEVIYYTGSVFTVAQRQQVEGYLAWKWGLVASLPSDHLYKNSKP